MVIEPITVEARSKLEAALVKRAGVRTIEQAFQRVGIGRGDWDAALDRAVGTDVLALAPGDVAEMATRLAFAAQGHAAALSRVGSIMARHTPIDAVEAVKRYAIGEPLRRLLR